MPTETQRPYAIRAEFHPCSWLEQLETQVSIARSVDHWQCSHAGTADQVKVETVLFGGQYTITWPETYYSAG